MRGSIETVLPRVIELQRDIHAHPEIGFDTVRTAAIVARELESSGLKVRTEIGKTGVVGDLRVPGATQTVAFRADMDALPMDEDNDLPHRSTIPGAAHLCGHDAHTAMLLGAARVLSDHKESLPHSLRFIFQPNEEALPGGAPAMIADGCLEGVDRIFGMHVWPLLPTGNIGIHAGPTMAQPDNFSIRLTGVGGHAAAPHKSRDPIVVGSQLVACLQSIVSRNVDPLDSAVLSVTQFHSGTADNVIPEHAELRGTIRSFRPEVGKLVRERLRETALGLAQAHGVDAEVEILEGYPVVDNDPASCTAAETAISNAPDLNLPVTRNVDPSLGGEDFAYYLKKVRGAFLFLGNYDESQDIRYFCHHPKFRVDDRAMLHGIEAWVALGSQATSTQ